ncbi:glycosyltransferase [Alphaproteobacteria bacterium]|nr:glycosyltransferase [Alphaproteobacteria bacterium]
MLSLMKNKCKITVLMSVYNGEKWISKSVKSILLQTYNDFEFLIVNDGSTDKTLNIIKQFCKIDKRIRLINKKNTGLIDSLNLGILKANGDWIVRIDADDISESSRLEKLIKFVKQNNNVLLVGSFAQLIDNKSKIIGKLSHPLNIKKLLLDFSIRGAPFAHSTVMFNVNAAKKISLYDKRIIHAEDLDMWLRLSLEGEIACIDKYLSKIRIHEDQVSDVYEYNQFISSYVAMINYWCIKINGATAWDLAYRNNVDFYKWVEKEIKNNNYFKFHKSIISIKKIMRNEKNKLLKCIIVLKFILFNGDSFIWLVLRKYKIVNFPKTIAKRFIMITSSRL